MGPAELGVRPAIAGVVTSEGDLASLSEEVLASLDVLEVRADMFPEPGGQGPASAMDECRRLGKAVLLTVRANSEGGHGGFSDDERLDIYLSLLDRADAIDVELASEALWPKLIPECRSAGKIIIGSFHDFEKTPPDSVLESMYRRCGDLGGDVFKAACMAGGPDDLAVMLAFAARHRESGVIAISMGDWGLVSRVAAPVLGSLLTYGSISVASAPGQLSSAELARYLDVFCRKRHEII